jgi:hypothetical protein
LVIFDFTSVVTAKLSHIAVGHGDVVAYFKVIFAACRVQKVRKKINSGQAVSNPPVEPVNLHISRSATLGPSP